jgi:hypothetical protein
MSENYIQLSMIFDSSDGRHTSIGNHNQVQRLDMFTLTRLQTWGSYSRTLKTSHVISQNRFEA